MNAPPFPVNPVIGQRFGNWAWNGVRWVSTQTTGIAVITTVFTASGSYMPSPGLVSLTVECIGGGGGGGGAGWAPSALYGMSGGGGGSGGYSRKTLPASLVLGGVYVTVGQGGDAGTPGVVGNAADGTATTFGALCVANGGGGGGTSAGVAGAYAGASGQGAYIAGAVGDWTAPGASGTFGALNIYTAEVTNSLQGALGGQPYGGSRTTSVETGGQVNGPSADPNSGAGGTGGCVNQVSGDGAIGGNGGSGVCIVTEYCWADGNEDDCLTPPINVNARVAVTHVPWTGPGPCPPGWSDDGC